MQCRADRSADDETGYAMGDVIANMSMSLDGFVEDATGSALPLFGWLEQTSGASADFFREAVAQVGASSW
jgi:hypothetical protein